MAKNINFTETQKAIICNRYLSGCSTYEISREFGCSNVAISRILKYKNVNIRSKRLFNTDIEAEVCNLYMNKTKPSDLANIYNCSQTAIIGILKRNKVKIRTNGEAHKKYSLDENYFDIVDSEDKAYWLGWFYADGCNQKNSSLSLELNHKDKSVIELFKKYIKSNRTLYLKKHEKVDSYMFRLCIRSEQLSSSLKKLGCVYNKSLILKFPTDKQVPKKFLNHFIRGYMEGDGCVGVYKNKNMVSMLGTKQFLKGVKKYFEDNGIFKSYINKRTPNKNTFSINIWTISEIIKFKKLIYDDYLNCNSTNSDLILERKYKKLQEIECKYFKTIDTSLSHVL